MDDFAGFQRRWLLLTVFVVVAGTLVTVMLPDPRIWHGFILGGFTAVIHLRLLSRSISRFGASRLKLGGSGARIAMVGAVLFLSAKRPDLFVWWSTLLGFMSEKVAMGLAVLAPNLWPSQRGN